MTSVEKPAVRRAPAVNAFCYSRLLKKPDGPNVKLTTDHFNESSNSKKMPPPVPPRTAKTYNIPLSTPAGKITAPIFNCSTPVITTTSIIKKKIPPPVPKKPVHLQLSGNSRRSVLTSTPSTDSQNSPPGQNLNIRLFALLLSPSTPTTPTPTAESIAKNVDEDQVFHATSEDCSRRTQNIQRGRPSALFGSTPHLGKMVRDYGHASVEKNSNFDTNNNLDDGRQKIGEEELQISSMDAQQPHRRSLVRTVRRKSLPLFGKSPATTPTNKTDIYHSDGRSAATSHCSSSFGAERGSTSSVTDSSPPPPIPTKDYYPDQQNPTSSAAAKASAPVDGEEELESVVFFSTISTVSSCQISRDCSADGRSTEKQDINSARANKKRSSQLRQRSSLRTPNSLLNEFLLDQSRRSVSIIERNARIIKWLYNCSKS